MNRIQICALVLSAMALPLQAATAQGEYDDPKRYARVGVLLGVPSEDFPGSVDLDPGAGFNLTLGYRFREAYAGELDFRYLAGADISGVKKDLSLFSVTANAKAYPMVLAGVSLTDWLEPYVVVGAGLVDVDVSSEDTTSFAIRTGAGVDLMIWDDIGVYVDAGYLIITDDDTLLEGQAEFVLGFQYRF